MKEPEQYDCIVIGGGPAGLIAAIQAASSGARTAVIEKNQKLCKKLRITGKGRCNITNACDFDTLLANIPTNSKFLISAFRTFSNLDILDFFHSIGLETVVERGGRVFPKTQNANDVAEALISYAKKQQIDFYLKATVDAILSECGAVTGVTFETTGKLFKTLSAHSVIVATGGLSYPLTGSTGDGYRFARQAGHTVVPTRPSLAALLSKEPFLKELQGLSLKNVAVSLIADGKTVYTDFGEMLFTDRGVSGPVILSASAHFMPQKQTVLEIDFKPALDMQKLYERIQRDFTEFDRKIYANALDKLLPQKMIPVFIKRSGILPGKQVNQINREERMQIARLLKCFPLRISGIDAIQNAVVTAGGIHVKEIQPGTMESKLCKGLFFAGEVLDADGYTGGFNLTIAFSTGYVAGRAAGKKK